MKIVYCDNGAYRKELKELDRKGIIKLIQFKYENKNKNINNIAHPANPTWKQDQTTWDEGNYSWDDYGKTSNKRNEIISLVGLYNELDIKHLESAHLSECDAFITNDKDDIWSKRNEIKKLLNIEVFHYIQDWEKFVEFVNS